MMSITQRNFSLGFIVAVLSGCISSKFDREHHCKMTCKGECNSSCDIIMEQGSTEITLPGQ